MQLPSCPRVRLSIDQVLSLRFRHLLSRVDQNTACPRTACGRITLISGYTEWEGAAAKPVSLGWDWQMTAREHRVYCVRVGLPRTNVMLIDGDRRDYEWHANLVAMATVVDALMWSVETLRAVAVPGGEA